MAFPTLAILISGSGSNLQAIIDAVQAGRLRAHIAVLVSNRKAAYGLERAQQAGIPTRYHPLKPYRDAGKERADYDADMAAILAEYAPDWIVLAGWMHIFTDAFLRHYPNRIVNLHPALPGRLPGAHAIDDALVEGTETIVATLSNQSVANGSASLGVTSTSTNVTEIDADVTFNVSSTASISEELGETATFTVTLTGGALMGDRKSVV